MRPPKRDLEIIGITQEEIRRRIYQALACGNVLYNRKVSTGIGISGNAVAQQWIITRPVIEDGIIVRLNEDDYTSQMNAIGRFKYGLRPTDINLEHLRAIGPDVYSLSKAGFEELKRYNIGDYVDIWDILIAAACNHVPAYNDQPSEFINTHADATRALEKIGKGEARGAIHALLDGLHLVDVAEPYQTGSSTSYRRIWKPLQPGYTEKDIDYSETPKVKRHTSMAGRNGFSSKTFSTIAPLLVKTNYDPHKGKHGCSYQLDGSKIEAAKLATVWVDEADLYPERGSEALQLQVTDIIESQRSPEDEPPFISDDSQDSRGLQPQSNREASILAMIEGRPFEKQGEPPSRQEIAHVIIKFSRDNVHLANLIVSAMKLVDRYNQIKAKDSKRWWHI